MITSKKKGIFTAEGQGNEDYQGFYMSVIHIRTWCQYGLGLKGSPKSGDSEGASRSSF